VEYEEAVDDALQWPARIVPLCSYAGAECNVTAESEVMHAHHCAFEKSEPRRTGVRGLSVFWTLIEVVT